MRLHIHNTMTRLLTVMRRKLIVHLGEGAAMPVEISVPTDSEECPLTMTLIKDDELPFAPGLSFSKTYTTLKKITLPCSHSFGVMSLMYHFAQNQMRCPLCRAGHAHRMDTRSIPVHLRRHIMQRIREVDREQMREELRVDEEFARSLVTGFIQDLDQLIIHVYMTVYGIFDEGERLEIMQFRMGLIVPTTFHENEIDAEAFYFGISAVHRRSLLAALDSLSINRIALEFSTSMGDSRRQVSMSPEFDVRSSLATRTIPCSEGLLSVTSLAGNEQAFCSLIWSVSGDRLFAA